MKSIRGFTLIELLITMVVVAVLATLAINSYRGYVMEAHRSDAWSALLNIQAAEEKFFLQNGTYTIDLTDNPPTGLGLSATTANGSYYTLTVTADTVTLNTNTIATTYRASAVATGTQANDTSCLTFQVNTLGSRLPADSTGCWH
jgi:type IV pilus assembly protein PilE